MAGREKLIVLSGGVPPSIGRKPGDPALGLLGTNAPLVEDIDIIELSQLRRLLVAGDAPVLTTLEFLSDGDQPGKPVFDVYAIDLATTTTRSALPGKSASMEGRQQCLCTSLRPGETDDDNWYRLALKEYFNTPPKSSLLAYPSVLLKGQRWWILKRWAGGRGHAKEVAISKESGDAPDDAPEFAWEDTFLPLGEAYEQAVANASSEALKKRFQQYGASVFKALDETLGRKEASSAVLLWVYVGPQPSEAAAPVNPPWALSLFALLRPANGHPVNWLEKQRYRVALRSAVQTIYFSLSMTGYVQHERERQKRDDAIARLSRSVTHAYKNFTGELASAAHVLKGRLAVAKLHPAGLLESLEKLTAQAEWLSGYSMGLYMLTDHETKSRLIFEPDPGCRVVRAAVLYSLDMLGTNDPDWVVQEGADGARILQEVYGIPTPERLIESEAVALLMVLVSETTRNIRKHAASAHRKVKCWTEVNENRVLIWQQAYEQADEDDGPEDHRSEGVSRTNELLTDRFGVIDEYVRVGKKVKTKTGWMVDRYSTIQVFGIPARSTTRKV